MMRICCRCDKPLKTGDAIKVTVYALYEELKSKVHYALSKPYDADGETMRHINCENPTDE